MEGDENSGQEKYSGQRNGSWKAEEVRGKHAHD